MNDTIDDAMAEDGDEAEESEIINKVLEEIGIGMNQEVLPGAQWAEPTRGTVCGAKGLGWRSSAAASLRIGLRLHCVATCGPLLRCAALRPVRMELRARIGSVLPPTACSQGLLART